MRKILPALLTFLARFIAVLLTAITVFATIFVLLLTSLEHTLFKAEIYKRALVEHQVYEQLPRLVSEQLPTLRVWLADPCLGYPLACAIQHASPEAQACLKKDLDPAILEDVGSRQRKPTLAETQTVQACLDQFGAASSTAESAQLTSGQVALLKDLNSAQWQSLIAHALPPDAAQAMIETALDEIFAYYKGQADAARMLLTSLKARLTGQNGAELIVLLLNDGPPCTEEQLAQINAYDFGADSRPPLYCTAQGDTLRKLSADLQRRLDQAASEIPEAAILIQSPPDSDPTSGWNWLGNTPQARRQRIYTGIRFSPLLVLLLLLLVALFGVRSLRGWLRWWSIPILIGSLITLGIGIASLSLFGWAWGKYVIPAIPSVTGPNLIELERELVYSLVKDFSPRLVVESGLLTLLSLGLLIGSTRVSPPPDPSLPPLAPPGTPGGPLLVPRVSKPKRKSR